MLPALMSKIFVDHIQSVHLLTFVLVKTFDLDIKDRVWIDFHTLMVFQVTSQFTFVVSFDVFQFFFDMQLYLRMKEGLPT